MTAIASADRTLVSCLMVTHPSPDRLDCRRRAIAGFVSQSHPRKELLVVIDQKGEDDDVDGLVREITRMNRPDIRIVQGGGALTLGALRNLSLQRARGEVLCQWDDDDLYHPDRVRRQLVRLVENDLEAVYLQDVMQYFPSPGALFWTNWRGTEAKGHPGTLMMRQGLPVRYCEEGPKSRLGEDLDMALQLQARGSVGFLTDAAPLFVYVSHGKNSWSQSHHQMLASSLAISKGLLTRREPEIREALAAFDFGPNAVSVRGSNGVAFRLAPGGGPPAAEPPSF
jgi:hypothetical protein